MRCPNCEANVPADAVECPYCGAEFEDAGPVAPDVNERPSFGWGAEPDDELPSFDAEPDDELPYYGAKPDAGELPYYEGTPAGAGPARPAAKKGRNWLLIGGVAVVVLLGCCIGIIALGSAFTAITGSELSFPETAPDRGPGPGMAALTVTNNLNEPVCFVVVSPPESETWGDGEDLLDSDQVIDPGETVTVFARVTSEVDIGFLDCDGQELDGLYGVAIREQGLSHTVR